MVWPTGKFSPRKRTSADMTASKNADITLSRIARSTFMDQVNGATLGFGLMAVSFRGASGSRVYFTASKESRITNVRLKTVTLRCSARTRRASKGDGR